MNDQLSGLSPAARERIEAMAARVRGAEAILQELDIEAEFSIEGIAKIDAAVDKMQNASIAMKDEINVLKLGRRAIRDQIESFLAARGYLHEIRPAQPGDVSTEVGTAVPDDGGV